MDTAGMKTRWLAIVSLVPLLVASACSLMVENLKECANKDDCEEGAQCVQGICKERTHVEITDMIGSDTTWTADKVYVLKTIVTVLPSVTLTIEPGTLIKGDRNSALVVRKGGQLIAAGTREKPILFTSAKPAGQRVPGDWGGVALLGKASVNRPNAYLNILTDEVEAQFGGTEDDWSCGTVQYVRIEFAGGQVEGKEALNGLTLAGCGTQTVVDHVHIHFGNDDGMEIFGGTVNVRYLAITRAQDDGIDIDLGWRGHAQFVAIQQDAGGDNAIEVDNLKEDPAALPQTDFRIYNYTLIGSHSGGVQRGITFKDGAAGRLSHGIMMGQGLEAVDVFGNEAGAQAKAGNIEIAHTLFFQIGENDAHYFPAAGEAGEINSETNADDDDGFAENEAFAQTSLDNRIDVDPAIADPYNLANPSWVPAPDNTTGQAIPVPPDGYDPTAVYLGAFSPSAIPWTEDWTAFPEH